MNNFKQDSYIIKDFFRYKKQILIILIITATLSLAIMFGFKFIKDPPNNNQPDGYTKINFESENIPVLRLGHYTLWGGNSDGSYTFIKRFNALDGLTSLDTEKLIQLEADNLNDYTSFIVTLEPEGDRNEEIDGITFLEGAVVDNRAELKFVQSSLLTDQLTGTYILATPSDGNNGINEKSGVWFTNTEHNQASLDIPSIESSMWTWEARLIKEDTTDPLILGRFQSNTGPDSSNSYSEISARGYSFPGEDFLSNLPDGYTGPLNLSNGDYKIVISLEPQLSNTEDPTGSLLFAPILEALIPAGSDANTPLQLENIVNQPIITLTLE
ncbi:hypothetical protein KC909_06375 [Candidatus Dojkabacteria bacterium]|uniref:Uncharacterized protein n=1 Tax=Candidatus Dojkabacteria bacterium TaxID=2099670 RepID=A0A955L789_9BACT|nr:hypothetical protein [Candidatus Dojkabacteria bacterium]